MKKDIKEIPFHIIELSYSSRYAETLGPIGAKRLEEKDPVYLEFANGISARVNADVVIEFEAAFKIATLWEWLGPQLLAHLATYRLPSTQNISARQFLDLNVLGNPRELGIWRFLTKVTRSKIMGKQTLAANLPYCGLVPLYMAAQKKYNNVPYSAWVRDEVKHIVDTELWESISYDIPTEVLATLTPQKLIELREKGLSVPGKPSRNPKTYHNLVGIRDSELARMPRYLKAMLTQIWVAHPDNRHQYMILDPRDWDSMPAPLVSSSIFARSGSPTSDGPKQERQFSYDAPW